VRLTLIRHAEPQAALDAVVAGHRGCSGLSELGRAQAVALRERLGRTREITADVVFTSVLLRAVETANLVASVLGQAVEDCRLCELHPGECDGQPWADHGHRYPTVDCPDRSLSPGGETLREFDARVRDVLSELFRDHQHDWVAVVGHSGVIESATLLLMGAPGLAERRSFALNSLRYTSITEWVRPPSGIVWTLQRYNDACHLDGLADSSVDGPWRP
jgi:probable phosphoglycerate mutase